MSLNIRKIQSMNFGYNGWLITRNEESLDHKKYLTEKKGWISQITTEADLFSTQEEAIKFLHKWLKKNEGKISDQDFAQYVSFRLTGKWMCL